MSPYFVKKRLIGKENFNASEGWFHRWKNRENIVWIKPLGEQGDADSDGASEWLKEYWPNLSSQYKAEDGYNADETALYYRALPETTYLFKSEKSVGFKIAKDRITVLVCVSMSGQKSRLLVIGKSRNPRCFKNVKNLPVDYFSNTTAWMTSTILEEWLITWDRALNRDILLLIDNCPAH